MKILFVTSEAHPLCKTGGLGDVAGALPVALRQIGLDVRLLLPAYRDLPARAGAVRCASLPEGELLQGLLPGSDVPVYLLDRPALYDRPGGPYGDEGQIDWPDNADRFAHLARAAVRVAQDRAGLDYRPDIVHCHDWPTGLVPALLLTEPHRPATVFTIHNLSYQGIFPAAAHAALGLPEWLWHPAALEFHQQLSFIKGGLVFADRLTAVSPTYAREIRTPVYGSGLDGVLNARADMLTGILNGADYSDWSPERDGFLPACYSRKDSSGKARNKAALQAALGLPVQPRTPLLASIGRLVAQKGIDLVIGMAQTLPTELDVQLVILGTGETPYEQAVAELARQDARVRVELRYSEELAHRIEAGADIFLMPSRFEPCGLNQIYSLRYGTVPVVRRTGGLADTVRDAHDAEPNGFLFDAPDPIVLRAAVDRALAAYHDAPRWLQLMQNGMSDDYSWTRSAQAYRDLYRKLA